MKDKDSQKALLDLIHDVLTGRRETFHAPPDPVALGEVELGTLQSEKAKALYSLRQAFGQAVERLKSPLVTAEPSARRPIQQELSFLWRKYKVLDELFWIAVNDEFPQVQSSEVVAGIRREWRVVIFKAPQSTSGPMFGLAPVVSVVPQGELPPEVIRALIEDLRGRLPPEEMGDED